jgi:hypothetical protein
MDAMGRDTMKMPNHLATPFGAGFLAASVVIALLNPYTRPSPADVFHTVQSQEPAPVVVLVFQLRDCASVRSGLAKWVSLDSTGVIAVRLMLDGSKHPENSLRFDENVLSATNRGGRRFFLVARSLGYDNTPFVMAWDHRGRLAVAGDAVSETTFDAVSALVREWKRSAP